MRQPVLSFKVIGLGIQLAAAERHKHKRILTVVFLQSFKHVEERESEVQHIERVQAEQFVQDGDEDNNLQSEII